MRELLLNNNIVELVKEINKKKKMNYKLKIGIGQIYNNIPLKDLINRIKRIDGKKCSKNKFINKLEIINIDIELEKYKSNNLKNFDKYKEEVKDENINKIIRIFNIDHENINNKNQIKSLKNNKFINNDRLNDERNKPYDIEDKNIYAFKEKNKIEDFKQIDNKNIFNNADEENDNKIKINNIRKAYIRKNNNYIKYFY